MTNVYLVRHAQPDSQWVDDRTRPLTALGLEERKKVTDLLSKMPIDVFYSSPYKRSMDTISECADFFKMDIRTDERFRERKAGDSKYAYELLERRWSDFSFSEPGGESIGSVQSRNIEAFKQMLIAERGKNIVLGTHGMALSTIINHYDPSFACEEFKRIRCLMPYVARLGFDGGDYLGREELLCVESFY